MEVNKILLKQRLALLNSYLVELARLAATTRAEFLADAIKRFIA